jgi:hypothetical protein
VALRLAEPLTRATVPSGVLPSKKLTVPVGVAPVEVRSAVRRVGLSRKTGLTELVRATVTTLRTVCETGADVAVWLPASPL